MSSVESLPHLRLTSPSLPHNQEPAPLSLSTSIPTSQSPKHVVISISTPQPSIRSVEITQAAGEKYSEQSQSPATSYPAVGDTIMEPTIAQVPATSALPDQEISQGMLDASAHSTNNPSNSATPGIGGPRDITQFNEFWNAYNDLADKEDKDIVKGYGSDLDTLLIFAGLFSATNTAFIIESYKDLKEDQAETTNKLLRSLILSIHQPSSFTELYLHEARFSPTKKNTSTNILFFTSLFCSLFAAFGAVIGKQWLDYYEREGQLRSPAERGLERHKKFLGLEQWHFQAIIATLPTLLQISLLSFFVGLVQFLWALNLPVASVALIFTIVTGGFWFIFTAIGVSSPSSPFQTRLTIILQKRLRFSTENSGVRDATQDEIIGGRCVDWLMKRTTAPATLAIIAKAMAMLSETAKKAINLDSVGEVIGYLVQSKVGTDNRVHLGLSNGQLRSCLVTLRDITRNWDASQDRVHPEDYANKQFIRALRHQLWDLLFNMDDPGAVLKGDGLQVLGRLYGGVELDLSGQTPTNLAEIWEARCLAWFKHCTAESERVWIVSKSILQGPTIDHVVPKLGRPLGLLLNSEARDDCISLHVSEKSLRVLMPILKDLISSWDSAHDLVHQEDSSNYSFLRTLSTKLWCMIRNPNWRNEESDAAIFEVLGMLGMVEDVGGLQPMIKALHELLETDSITPMHKLRYLCTVYRKLASLKQVPKDYIQLPDAVNQLLLSTMWESDGEPEFQYADIRVGWILDNFDTISPLIIGSGYIRYLSMCGTRWHLIQASELMVLYFRSLRRMLVMDHEVWSTELELDSSQLPLTSVIYGQNSHTVYLHCLAYFFLLFKGVRSEPTLILTRSHNRLSNECAQIIQNYLSNNGQGLFDSVIAIVDSPREGVWVVTGLWRLLVAAHYLGQIEIHRISAERDKIAGYLMGRPAIAPPSVEVLANPLESGVELRLRSLPNWYTADIYPAVDDVDRCRFILSLLNNDPDIQFFITEVFSHAISRLQFCANLEDFLGSLRKIFSGPYDVLIEILEKEDYIQTIADVIGAETGGDETVKPPRDVQWWCLRLFFVMWHRRSAVNPTPYISNHCFQQLSNFFSSMENRVEEDVAMSQRSIDKISMGDLSALGFMDSACSYFEFVSAEEWLRIPIAIVSGYRETCGDFTVSGANRAGDYQGNDGMEKWKQDIAPLVKRMEALSR